MSDLLRGDGFLKFTDTIIRTLEQRGITARSSNYLICKPHMEEVTDGGIILSQSTTDLETRRSGYARVVACPNNDQDDKNYADIKPGMFVLYNHAGHFKPSIQAIRLALGIKDFPEDFLYLVPDNEILFTVHNSDTGKRF